MSQTSDHSPNSHLAEYERHDRSVFPEAPLNKKDFHLSTFVLTEAKDLTPSQCQLGFLDLPPPRPLTDMGAFESFN